MKLHFMGAVLIDLLISFFHQDLQLPLCTILNGNQLTAPFPLYPYICAKRNGSA